MATVAAGAAMPPLSLVGSSSLHCRRELWAVTVSARLREEGALPAQLPALVALLMASLPRYHDRASRMLVERCFRQAVLLGEPAAKGLAGALVQSVAQV